MALHKGLRIAVVLGILIGALSGVHQSALAACTSPAGIAGGITWNGTDSVIWCDGASWYRLKDAASSSMVSGWPDAISCTVTSPNYAQRTYYSTSNPHPDGRAYYREINGGNGGVIFNSDGTFSAYENLTTTNCNITISALYAAGRAYNFVGGGSSAAAGSSGSAGYIQFSNGTGGFSYSGTAVGQQLLWDNTNKSLGIGTSSPAAKLDVNGFMRLAKNGSAPATCDATIDGAIALTSARRMCVCDATSWKEVNSATTCTW